MVNSPSFHTLMLIFYYYSANFLFYKAFQWGFNSLKYSSSVYQLIEIWLSDKFQQINSKNISKRYFNKLQAPFRHHRLTTQARRMWMSCTRLPLLPAGRHRPYMHCRIGFKSSFLCHFLEYFHKIWSECLWDCSSHLYIY